MKRNKNSKPNEEVVTLRILPTVSCSILRNVAEEKKKNFHSNLYDKSQSYHLLYEDRSKALFLPSSKKEIFMLSR